MKFFQKTVALSIYMDNTAHLKLDFQSFRYYPFSNFHCLQVLKNILKIRSLCPSSELALLTFLCHIIRYDWLNCIKWCMTNLLDEFVHTKPPKPFFQQLHKGLFNNYSSDCFYYICFPVTNVCGPSLLFSFLDYPIFLFVCLQSSIFCQACSHFTLIFNGTSL